MFECYLSLGLIAVSIMYMVLVILLYIQGVIEIYFLIITIIIAIICTIGSIRILIRDKYCTFYYGPVRRRQRQETERRFINT